MSDLVKGNARLKDFPRRFFKPSYIDRVIYKYRVQWSCRSQQRFKMTRVILQMIVLGFLIIFINQAFLFSCSDAARHSKCVSDEEMRSRSDKLVRKYRDTLGISDEMLQQQQTRTCPQTAKEMHGDLSNRSLSPWRYRMDHDGNRFPATIAFAECVCEGCIINRHEDLSYNSVPVYSPIMILKKTPCKNDSKKYVVKKDFIRVPVSCTCTVPNYAK